MINNTYRNTFAAGIQKKRKMRLRIVLRYAGVSLLMLSVLMLVSALVSLKDGADSSTLPLFFSAAVTFTTGMFPFIFVRPETQISTTEGYYIVVFSWITACLFGMLPYLCYGGEFTFTNALFESVSGFTTTGASILNDIESLPTALKFWRTATAWVGGIGLVTIFSLMVPKGHDGRSVLSGAEISDIARSQSQRRGKSFIMGMLMVYVCMTLLCCLAFKLTGMRWLDAVTNAMSTCSTCGFCVMNSSIAAYDSLAVEIITMVFMTAAGISFIAIYTSLQRKNGARHHGSEVFKAYLSFLAIGVILMTFDLKARGVYDSIPGALRAACFQLCSITTTTGFATADTTTWPAFSVVLLCLASIVCGCSGSTSGGMKTDRIVIITKQVWSNLRMLVNPKVVTRPKMDGVLIREDRAKDAMSFVLIYMAFLLIGAVVNTIGGLDLTTGVTAAIACLGNVGPGFGSVGSFGNYADFPEALKYGSMLLMIAGRLEITPLLFVLVARSAR